jgi:peptide/nickel transport system substrate-binding protein
MTKTDRKRRIISAGAVLGVLSIGLLTVAPASEGGASTPTTATWAEAPHAPPNYIFPFMSLASLSASNVNQFQYLMYRPLYWFGAGSSPTLNQSLSLAESPVYAASGETVTIDLKHYKWSNGETVTAVNVMFWMNMLHAQKEHWGGYVPGALPDDVQRIAVDNPEQLTFTLDGPVDQTWFTNNQLSQITPLPNAWDITGPGRSPNSGGCADAVYGTADARCTAVWAFLSQQASDNPTMAKTGDGPVPYASNPLWKVVDGPWMLTRFDRAGNVSFAPNPSYSGPIRASVKRFDELPFASGSAEFAALVGGKVAVGYLPFDKVTRATANALSGGPNNPELADYSLHPLYSWSIRFAPYNFNSTGDGGNAGRIFSQLYVRQALQYLIDQPRYIKQFDRGYGVGTYGPVPSVPPNPFVTSQTVRNPYPYNPGKAVLLLQHHGWDVVPHATTTCVSPGIAATQCGAGIPAGAKLAFSLQYTSGQGALARVLMAERSSWARAGIDVTLSQAPFATVLDGAIPCSASGKSCGWAIKDWGSGWIFAPDFYPTGEAMFQTGAGSNFGAYSDPVNDANILATRVGPAPLTTYENYLAEQLPVLFQPGQASALTEVHKGLSGVTPQNPLGSLNPENWRY